MSKEDRMKYIGINVYAGGRMKGYYGQIVDIIPDEEDPTQEWFIVANLDKTSGDGNPIFQRWDKSELQKVIISKNLIPLD